MDRIKPPRKILLLGLAVFFLFIVLILSWFHNPRQENDFRVSSGTEVVEVVFSKRGSESVKLEREKNGSWSLNNEHGVNEISLRDLFQTLNLLTTRQPVSRSIVDQVNQNLDEEGIMVTIVEKKPVLNLFNSIRVLPIRRTALKFEIGQDAAEGRGVYARKVGSRKPCLIHLPGSEVSLSGFFSPDFAYWFDPEVIDLTAGEIKKVEIQSFFPSRESLIIEIRNNNWILTANRQAVNPDNISYLRLNWFLDSFEELYFERLLIGQDSVNNVEMMVKPKFMQITVEDKSGKISNIDFYHKEMEENKPDPDLFFIVVNGKRLATARYFVFNRIIKPNSYFLR